jgi:chromosome segregation protein
MYISELKVHGFKSFAKKEVLRFGEGITTIVGPNGCGKTNLVDAIRWVLGEQKYSVLRSSRMEDVIFNGARGLKPLSVSEVYLTVHNDRGKLPVEYTEVEIGRRVYRSGESEYFINRTPCRLKDIQDLFVDTGMGADAYSVIELKMIEQILSDTGDDRRRMFEEAAGINKYKSQRRSAFRKFEATRQDLERIKDIILEVETKVKALNLQLKRYKRHAKLSERLKEKEIALATLRLLKLDQLLQPVSIRIRELEQRKESSAAEVSLHETELTQLQKTYQESDQELAGIQARLDALEGEREEQRQRLLVWSEQIRADEATLKRLQLELNTNQGRQEQLTNHLRDYEEEIALLDPRIEEKLAHYKEQKAAFRDLEERFQKVQSEREYIQARRWEKEREVADQQSLIDRTSEMIREHQEQIQLLTTKLQSQEAEQTELAQEQKLLESKKKSVAEELVRKQSRLAEMEKGLSKLQQKRHQLTLEHHATMTQAETLESQLQFYRELVATREGYPEGVRFILERLSDFPGIVGTIAELIEVQEEYRAAIDSSLGELAHCLVVEDRTTALQILAQAEREKVGRLTLIPLRELQDRPVRLPAAPEREGVRGRASDLVRVPAQLKPLVKHLLGHLLVVEVLDPALLEELSPDWDLVDLHGTYAGRDFRIKHHQETDHGSLVGRHQKIKELDAGIDRLVTKAQTMKTQLDSLDQEIARQEKKLEEISHEVEELLDEQSGVETEIIRNHYRQSRALEAMQETTHLLTEKRKALHQLTDSLDALTPRLQEERDRLEILNEKVTAAGEALDAVQEERDTFHQQLQDMRIDLLNLENQRDNLQFQKQTAAETLRELEKRRESITAEMETVEQNKEHLQQLIAEGKTALERVNGKLAHERSVLELKQSSHRATFQAMEEIQEKIRTEQRTRENVLEELKQCELRIAEYEQQIRLIRERIQDRYQLEITVPSTQAEQTSIQQTLDDEDELELEIQRIERSLENIGPINMAVQAEYEEEYERLQMLYEQRDDLVEAEQNLRETIQKIDRVARKQFRETFDRIKSNFEQLFTLFFNGGRATLSLVGDPDPLEADIAIQAQPPGKRNQSLRMLSAGEKALTAIALLFAIYQVKPSPYCILDEVDAPLDDVNIRKFTRALKQFSKDTQFIIVTHNKLTMEAADYMYGVTMEQKGVSRLVSVKFDQ